MALKIRLRQQGRTNRQSFRLVVTDIRTPRDGKYLEMLGWYDPLRQEGNCTVDTDRLNHWVGLGAQISPRVRTLLSRVAPDVMKAITAKEHSQRVKSAAKRRALKKA